MNGSLFFRWINATAIARIIGRRMSLVNKPDIRNKEQANSQKIASIRVTYGPKPNTLGKVKDSSLKFHILSRPCIKKRAPKNNLIRRRMMETARPRKY